MSSGGWAVSLDGTVLTGSCDDWNRPDCSDEGLTIVEFLSEPPDGMGLPELRTEDLTFTQRDGVRHYADWYEPRIITLTGTVGPGDEACEDCTGTASTRQQLASVINTWRRTCCDTELVIFTDCDGEGVELPPILVQTQFRTNLFKNPSVETNLNRWEGYVGDPLTRTNVGTPPPSGSYYARLTIGSTGMDHVGVLLNYSADGGDLQVTEGVAYTLSGYMRPSFSGVVGGQCVIRWRNSAGLEIGQQFSGLTVMAQNAWTRVSATAVAPAGAVRATFEFGTYDDAHTAGDFLDFDAILFEAQPELLDYFDGDTADSDNPVIGGEKVVNVWAGVPHASASYQQVSVYEENKDRSLVGPFGIVGRPRVATYKWLPRKDKVAEVLLRFDGVDQRMYVLDECGTPGYGRCLTLNSGVSAVGGQRCYPRCYVGAGGGGRCYTPSELAGPSNVPEQTLTVRGTEKAFPTITLYPSLNTPTITNETTGEFITYNGVVDGEPVTINTEDGTAFQAGESRTHLLSGSIYMGLPPGDYVFSVSQAGQYGDAVGDITICWRDAVVMG